MTLPERRLARDLKNEEGIKRHNRLLNHHLTRPGAHRSNIGGLKCGIARSSARSYPVHVKWANAMRRWPNLKQREKLSQNNNTVLQICWLLLQRLIDFIRFCNCIWDWVYLLYSSMDWCETGHVPYASLY
jgi:hypothetical protein